MDSKIRLDRLLAESGFGTRKEVKKLIKKGYVIVNGKEIKDPSIKIDINSTNVEVEGKPVNYIKDIYVILNKPSGYITSTKDKEMTVMELVSDIPRFEKLFPVGRLDKDTEGLLFITNDGELAHRLTHPKWKVPKKYFVIIEGELSERNREKLNEGIDLGDFKTKPAQVTVLKNNKKTSELEIEIKEGKYHQVKRMFEKVGNPVIYLKRISFGNLLLGKLHTGEYRFLTEEEISQLKSSVNLTKNK